MVSDPTEQVVPPGGEANPAPAEPSPGPAPKDAPEIHEVHVGLNAGGEPAPPEPAAKEETPKPASEKVPATPADKAAAPEPPPEKKSPKVLAIDIGGSNVKILATGHEKPRRFPSGRTLTPRKMVEEVRKMAGKWEYDVVSLGYPGVVGQSGPRGEPGNLAEGWIGFDFAQAFDKPVKIINDAAMQALGSYEGGRMLFLGLGTGLGSVLISYRVIVPLELGGLWYRGKRMIWEYLGRDGMVRLGKRRWREAVNEIAVKLKGAMAVDYVVLGGGNAKKLGDELPPGVHRGGNRNAFAGAFRLWELELMVPTQKPLGHWGEDVGAGQQWKVV